MFKPTPKAARESALIVVDDNFVGIWFLKTTEFSDVMFGIMADGVDQFRVVTRFRYYDPDDPGNDPFSTKDHKSTHEYGLQSTREDVIAKVRLIVSMMELGTGYKAGEVLMTERGPEGAMDDIAKQGWAHVRKIPAAGAAP